MCNLNPGHVKVIDIKVCNNDSKLLKDIKKSELNIF